MFKGGECKLKLFSNKKLKRKERKEALKLSKGKECKKCGKCCKVLSFPFRNLDTAGKEYFLMHENVSIKEYKDKTYVVINSKCKYLTNNNLCSIHETKPTICRNAYDKTRKNVVFQEGCAFE